MKKKLACLVLALLMLVSVMPVNAFAAQTKCERPLQFEENIATELKKLNLFKGVSDTDFALGRVPSRFEALVIMLRLMGKEAEILAGEYKHPFTDVPAWADKYVGYAYENKLTNGISATKFGASDATDVQFMTFVLRAMNYSDADGDFTWDNPYDIAEKLGILTCAVTKGNGFLRADCVTVSFNALAAKLKDSTKTLADKLISDKVFTKAEYEAAVKAIPDYAGMLKAYGLADTQWHEYPKNDQEYIEDFLLSYIEGNWALIIDEPAHNNNKYKFLKAGDIKATYDSLLGEWLNSSTTFYISSSGQFYISTNGEPSYYSEQELKSHVLETYNAAIALKGKVDSYSRGRNLNSQFEVAKQYYDYLVNHFPSNAARSLIIDEFVKENHLTVTFGQYIMDHREYATMTMTEDGAYNLLINNWGPCSAHSALFDLMMHIEGIEAYGLMGDTPGGGHIVSYVVLDGQSTLVDWGNKKGMCKLNDCETSMQFILDRNSLLAVETARFSGDTSMIGTEYTGRYR